MILIHHSPRPLLFDPAREYALEPHPFKPEGLWLSDDSEYGWAEWCRGHGWNARGLVHSMEFECDTSRWLKLETVQALLEFTREFTYDDDRFSGIDWEKVRAHHSGILITPYLGELRLDLETNWYYYSWDCASACVWDLTTLQPLRRPDSPTGLAAPFADLSDQSPPAYSG